MDPVHLSLSLTPHGRLVLTHDDDAPALAKAFERGSGHGLLFLGADEPGVALPPDAAYWREFGARYVAAVCSHGDGDVHVDAPPDEELESLASAAPPMTGGEYLTATVLRSLWQELDVAFTTEFAESKLD